MLKDPPTGMRGILFFLYAAFSSLRDYPEKCVGPGVLTR